MRKLLAAIGRALRALFRVLGKGVAAPFLLLFGGGADETGEVPTPLQEQVENGLAREALLKEDLARSAAAVSANPGLRLVYEVQIWAGDEVFAGEGEGTIVASWPQEVKEWCRHLSAEQKELVVRSEIEHIFQHLCQARQMSALPAFPLQELDCAHGGLTSHRPHKLRREVLIENLAAESLPSPAPAF